MTTLPPAEGAGAAEEAAADDEAAADPESAGVDALAEDEPAAAPEVVVEAAGARELEELLVAQPVSDRAKAPRAEKREA